MLARIVAITFILGCTSLAWYILGGTIDRRTDGSDDKARPGVTSIWGAPQEQSPPSASYEQMEQEKVETETDGHKTTRTVSQTHSVQLSLDTSRINTALGLEYRQRGLLCTFRNPTSDSQLVTYRLKFPAANAIYDGLVMEVNGQPLPAAPEKEGMSVNSSLGPREIAILRVGYRSHGMGSWRYRLADEVGQARDFTLTVETNFKQVDFPLNALSPTEKHETPTGWELTWRYANLSMANS